MEKINTQKPQQPPTKDPKQVKQENVEQNEDEKQPVNPTSLQSIDEYFSNSMRRILIFANEEAKNAHAVDIDTEHTLMGILRNTKNDQVLNRIFQGLKIDLEEIMAETKKEIRPGKNQRPEEFLPFSARTKSALLNADMERRKWRHHATAGEHLLLGLLHVDGVAGRILKKYGITDEAVKKEIMDTVGEGQEKDALASDNTPLLDKYGVDLCQMAREGKIDPVIGRGEEIERTIHILARRRKNNPLLIGEPGVGKTAIVEGLANRIIHGDVPEVLKSKRLISLSINTLVAGASKRGEFEKRLEGVIREAIKSSGEVILFVDEIHTLLSGDSAGDAAQILKPPLARGEIHCIGATTLAEHHQHIEKDGAFSRRFQLVMVPEPSFDETYQILMGARDKYEAFHGVKIPEAIVRLAITLSTRYINDRYLPDKAFDLIDEASAMARMPSISTPEKEKELEKEIQKLRAEQERAKGVVDIEELTRIEKKVADKVKEMEDLRAQSEEAKSRSHDEVTEDHVRRIISRWSGVPMEHVAGSEAERLLKLEDVLHQRMIGQEYAVSAVASAVRRGRSGIRKPKRPIGSFMFLGPTGVGKTELAKTLGENLFGSENTVVRFDMSEFMEKHAVSRFTGPPPGYVGYEKGGELTEAVRKQPYTIILFDEVEKAHPDVFNMLLQVLDDGRLTDNHGRTCTFKNTIIICTSNIGSMELAKRFAEYWDGQKKVEDRNKKVREAMDKRLGNMKNEDKELVKDADRQAPKDGEQKNEATDGVRPPTDGNANPAVVGDPNTPLPNEQANTETSKANGVSVAPEAPGVSDPYTIGDKNPTGVGTPAPKNPAEKGAPATEVETYAPQL